MLNRSIRDFVLPVFGGLLGAFVGGSVVCGQSPGAPALNNSPPDYVDYAVDSLPSWFRTPLMNAADNTPADNPITNEGAELGRVLFYDTRLSHNDGTSCASCHVQQNGFSDPNQFSEGFEGGLTGRHSMGLANARFYQSGRFFWDERAATLEEQTLGPIQDPVEMGSNLPDLVNELAATEYYPVLFQRAFGDGEVTSERMAQAMAQFIRSMVSYQSKFDQALAAEEAGGQRSDVLTQQELDGHSLFASDCANCHRGDAQVANQPFNIGLDATDADEGAGDGEFKVPSLRNIGVRDGFMHDGRFTTLEEVVEFYSSGVQDNPNKSNRVPTGGFGYTDEEEAALVAFLNTLTDEAFLSDENFANPFVVLGGDYNGDGVVDGDDYLVWKDGYGLSLADVTGALWADGNLDGVVDASDFTVWRDNLGARWDDAPLSLAAVPEPSTALLLGGMSCGALAARRHRRRRAPPGHGIGGETP